MLNELVGLIMMQDIHPDGFKQITFHGLDEVNSELDEGLLDQLVY